MTIKDKLKKALSSGADIHIGVEGANFMHLLVKKIEDDPKFNRICFWDFDGEFGGREKWLKAITAQLDREISGIGIICDIDMHEDSDDGRARRIESIKGLFDSICNIQFEEAAITGNLPFYGYHIIPSTVNNGCLETALLENANPRNHECIESFVECLTNDNSQLNSNKIDKLKVRSIMLSKDPEMPYSATANTDLWDWNSGSLRALMDFLEDMNNQG